MIQSWRMTALVVTLNVLGWGALNSHGFDLHAEVDPLVKPLIDDHEMVGCVVGIVREGGSQILAYGETEKGSDEKPSGSTIYEIGSASKAFTGMLLADAVNAGVVSLDDPVQKHVPKSVKVPVKDDTPITLQHLATHTSGLPRLPNNMFPKDMRNPYADYTVKQLYEYLGGYEGAKKPGEYEYSNYGMGLLGHVLAKSQRTTYERLLIARIAKPLDMRDTCITLSDEQKKRFAPPYDAALEPNHNWDLPTLAGAGAIRSTADDLVKFIQASLAKDDKPVTKAIQLSFKKRHTKEDGQAVGLAWQIAQDGITRWHNGMTGGYSSFVAVVPEKKVGVVVLTNAATDETTKLGMKLILVACGIKVEPPRERKEIKVKVADLEPYKGVFAITPQFAMTITEENGQLMVQATGQSKLPMFAEGEDKFFLRVVDAQITFKRDKNGKVNALILHQNGANQRAKRTE